MEEKEVVELLNSLQQQGLIKILNWQNKEIILLPKLVSKLSNPIAEWIDGYRALFKGKKPGAMGSKEACIKKMEELFIRRPDLTKEKVMAATQNYINAESLNRWKYMMQADYFISKNQGHTKDGKISKLEAFCDDLEDTLDTNNNSFMHDI
jgi:hypothetical protein